MEQIQYAAQTPEQKDYKEAKERFRAAIKEKVRQQLIVKGERKPLEDAGGIYPAYASKAQSVHALNRKELHYLYIAYAIFRRDNGGYKKFPQTFDNVTQSIAFLKVMRDLPFVKSLIEKYGAKNFRINS